MLIELLDTDPGIKIASVADPKDPNVFWPPGSGSISLRHGSDPLVTKYGTFPDNEILSLATGLRENSARETGRKEGDLPRSAS